MSTRQKFGKSVGSILSLKGNYIEENTFKLEKAKHTATKYLQQPKRVHCKNCDKKLSILSFEKLGIGYSICKYCGHLNGLHEDTEKFCNFIYTLNEGKNYAKGYHEQDKVAYDKRLQEIYIPKAQFLMDSLHEQNEDTESLAYTDLGAGSGYFLWALYEIGLKNIVGYEVSKSQIDFAHKMTGQEFIIQHQLHEILSIVQHLECDVVSLIGVLEHVQQPSDLLEALSINKHIKYIYFSLPLFSPCIFFEMIFQDVYPRILTEGHTHLYTNASIEYFCKEFKFNRIAEWWFGLDIIDLYRCVYMKLGNSEKTNKMLQEWETIFFPLLDDLQLVLDQNRASSEVHFLVKKNI